jgi:hypothetical protein
MLWLSTSGSDWPRMSMAMSMRPRKSGTRVSMVVFGEASRTARTTSTKCWAPPSRRSSRSTLVITTYCSFSEATESASSAGSFGLGGSGLAVADVAERAAAGADVAEDHEGRRAAAEAFADVRAGGFLADGVQLLFAQHGLDFAEAPGAVAGFDANPLGFAQRGVDRDDLDRDAGGFQFAFLFDAFLLRAAVVVSHVVGPVAVASVERVARPPRER